MGKEIPPLILYLLYSYISVQIESGIILILDKMNVHIRIHVYREDHHGFIYVTYIYSWVIQFKIPAAHSKSHPPWYAHIATPPCHHIHHQASTIHHIYRYVLTNNPKVFVWMYVALVCVWAVSDSFCINAKQIIWENLYVLYLMYTFACVDMTGRGRCEAHYLCIISWNIKMEREIFNLYLINLNVRQWIYNL